MLHRLNGMLLAGMLICAVACPVAAESSSPGPIAVEQHFDLPDYGVAVTMPAGWEVTTDLGGSIFPTAILATPPGGEARCYISTFDFEGPTKWDIVDLLLDINRFDSSDGELVQLPLAGEAVRVLASRAGEEAMPPTVFYVFESEESFAWLLCEPLGTPPPDGLWLSIAEAFEFLPAER